MITIDQVTVFHKIVDCGSFKAAAEELHRTQPAISFAVKKLEEELGVELFDRTLYRPTLTSHGELFLEKSFGLLENMRSLEQLADSFKKKEEPEIKVSIDGIGLDTNLLKLFKRFSDGHPMTKLSMSFDILSEAERKVLQGEVEMGITHFVKEPNLLDVVPYSTIKMIPVMNRDLYRERKVRSQDDLKLIDQIVIGDKNPSGGANFGLLHEGKKWRILDSFFKKELILAGLGWGHLPQKSVERELKEKTLVSLNFTDIHPRELSIYLIRLKKHRFGPVAKNLWQELITFHAD
jgi:DNA-binding transcriptional LysR family regulator